MNKILLFLSLLMCYANISFSQDDTRGLEIKNNNKDSLATTYALVVGISSYANINHLLYADDDAYLFAEHLINQRICDRKNLVRLIDSAATTVNFYKELKRLINKTQPNDRVFIYFAGHGDVETELESGFLLTYNCESNNYSATAIEISMLEKFVNAFVNKKVKVVLITDACRSGNLAGGLNGASTTISSITKGFQNTVKLLSCQPTQLSLEKDYPDGGHGVFTLNLVEGLSGMADTDEDSTITLREIGFYLDKVRTETNKKQIPAVVGDPENIISNFDAKMLMALLAKKGNNTGIAATAIVKKRGWEDSTWFSNRYYQAFNEHIRKLHYIQPQENNAFFSIQEAEKNNQPLAMIEDMKLDLSAVLEDEAQKWINKYLRGDLEKQTNVILADLKKVTIYLETIERLIGEKDFRFTEIHVKKMFFDAYYVFKNNEKKSYDKAIRELEMANKLWPNQAYIYNLCGHLYREIKKYNESESAYKNAIRLAPYWPYPWSGLGNIYRDQKKYVDAEVAFWNGIHIDSNYTFSWYYLALINTDQKKYTEAKQYLMKAMQTDSLYAPSWYLLGYIYWDLKRITEAEVAFQKASQIDSAYIAAWNYLAMTYHVQKKYAEAETGYIKTIQIDSNHAMSWNNLGYLYFEQGKYKEAEAAYRKAIQIDSNFVLPLWNLATLYILQKNYTDAEATFRKVLEADPEDPDAYYNIACMNSLLKKDEIALEFLEDSFKKGYKNFGHIEKDTDMDNIRNSDAFKALIIKYKK